MIYNNIFSVNGQKSSSRAAGVAIQGLHTNALPGGPGLPRFARNDVSMKITALLLLTITLTACGIKGDLYLPGEKDKAQAEKTAQ